MCFRFLNIFSLIVVLGFKGVYAQCSANAGVDLSICDGDGSSSNYTYLDGSGSMVPDGGVNFEWTVLTVVGDGSWQETLVISDSESDESDPRFKYPNELAEDTEFFVELRVYDDSLTCEAYDTLSVFIQSNMCPRAIAGDDQILSNGCDLQVLFDGYESEDPQEEQIFFQWSSLDGYNANFIVSDSAAGVFEFPSTNSDQTFSFMLTVSDGVQSSTDTVKVIYLDNDAPIADAGEDILTCEYQFHLTASQSYDVNWNELSYSWSSLDGLVITDTNSDKPLVTSPTDLTEPNSYRVELVVSDGYCSASDTLNVIIEGNLCPIANAGETRRIPKF